MASVTSKRGQSTLSLALSAERACPDAARRGALLWINAFRAPVFIGALTFILASASSLRTKLAIARTFIVTTTRYATASAALTTAVVLIAAVVGWPAARHVFQSVKRPSTCASTIAIALGVLAVITLIAGTHATWPAFIALGSSLAFRIASKLRDDLLQAVRRGGVDDPVQEEEFDLFQRESFAKSIASHLTEPSVRCPRVALCGAVGTGKTTIANFVANRVSTGGNIVVRFDAWHCHSIEEARGGLVSAIEDAIQRVSGAVSIRTKARRWVLRATRGMTASQEWMTSFAEPIASTLRVDKDLLTIAIAESISLKDRLVIIIDNLERCDPAIANDLFMASRDTFDADGLAFLFLCDWDILGTAISSDLTKIDSKSIQEKVFDFRFEVPQPEPESLAILRSQFAVKIRLPANIVNTMSGLADLLPTTPRGLKRCLSMLAAQATRLGEMPKALKSDVVLAMMVLEYHAPGSVIWIQGDAGRVADFSHGALRDEMRKRSGQSTLGAAPLGRRCSAAILGVS